MNFGIDLSQLPAPRVVEALDFETIFSELKSAVIALMPVGEQEEFTATLALESEPITKLLQVAAYRELMMRQRINDSARAVMLAFAVGADLDQIGANFNVKRLVITPADPDANPPQVQIMESDADFRARIQISPEGYTTAGSQGSYLYHAMSADGDVKDIQVISDEPGKVDIYVLSRIANGEATSGLLEKVESSLNAEHIRPLTDQVSVHSAEVVEYSVSAELTMYPGPDIDAVRQAAEDEVSRYVNSVRRIGYDITLSGLYAALHRPGVQNVNITSPSSTVAIDDGESGYCTSIIVTAAGSSDV